VDIKETNQLNKKEQPVKPVKPVPPVKQGPISGSFIRTMAQDMAGLNGGVKKSPLAEPKVGQKGGAPPPGLPVLKSARKPLPPPSLPKPELKPKPEPKPIPEIRPPKPPIPPKPISKKVEKPDKPDLFKTFRPEGAVQPKTPISKPVLPKKRLKTEIEPKAPKKKKGILALIVVLIVVVAGGFFYWWNYIRTIPPIVVTSHYECQENQCLSVDGEGDDQCQTDQDCKPAIVAPDSLIPVTETKTIDLIAGQENLLLGQLKSIAAQEQTISTFKRILVKTTNQEQEYLDLDTLMLGLGISIPEPIVSAVASSSIQADNYTLFLYSQPEGNRLGLVIKMGESETLVQDLKNWETTALNDIKAMLLMDQIPAPATEGFQDNIHKDVYIRYMNFATPDLSLDYGLVPSNLVIATSRGSMFATIDALLAAEPEPETGGELDADSSSLCTDEPRGIPIGSDVYPIDLKYENIHFLGQLFTAASCGPERLNQIWGVEGETYILGSTIWLKENPSQDLINVFRLIGFECVEDSADESCKYWKLSDIAAKVNDLLELEPYHEYFSQDDCVNCG